MGQGHAYVLRWLGLDPAVQEHRELDEGFFEVSAQGTIVSNFTAITWRIQNYQKANALDQSV